MDKIKFYWEVGEGDSGVSILPRVSFGYGYCGAIALLNGREGGLSHTDSDDGKILYHLDKMIGDFDVPPEKLKVIPIAGKGMETLKRCCKDRGIKVVNEYQGDRYFDHLDRMFYYPRDVLLVPSSREVIIYTHEGKIHKLFDSFSDFSEFKPYPSLLEREFSSWAL